MAGALIIEGAFDDWLKKLYKGELVDRVMAIQQIAGRNNFYRNNVPNYPPQLLLAHHLKALKLPTKKRT